MKDIPITLADISGYLTGLEDFEPNVVKRYFDEDVPEKRLLFKIEYEPGEFVMAKGEYSDYVALHLQGLIRATDMERPKLEMPSCWDSPRPWRRKVGSIPWVGSALAKLFPIGHGEEAIGRPTDQGDPDHIPLNILHAIDDVISPYESGDAKTLKPVGDRFMGLTSVVWKIQRAKTLLADNEPDGTPCQVLLIKRRCMLDLLYKKGAPNKFYMTRMPKMLQQVLPEALARNRLFRADIFSEEVKDWPALAAFFQSPKPLSKLAREEWTGAELQPGLTSFDDALKHKMATALSRVMGKKDLYSTTDWARNALPESDQAAFDKHPAKLTKSLLRYRNRLVMESQIPGILENYRDYPLVLPEHFQGKFAELVSRNATALLPIGTEKDKLVFQAGDEADAMYLILRGKFRVSRPGSGGVSIYNHLEDNNFFGEACIFPDAEGKHRRGASIQALSAGTLIKIERSLLTELCEAYPALRTRLQRELSRRMRQNTAREAGQRLPPQEPPLEIATRLQVTTNLLVIDMERCTRCDQCVQACGAAHEDRPRFHRANPSLRFGKWEIAGACLHCSDAPCLEECPVGAITFLDKGEVQIHRNRCISCEKCFYACPFDVIDMYPPIDGKPADSASLPKNRVTVATKCDLCLEEEKNPPCVMACPYGAAHRGKPEEFFPGIKTWAQLTEPE